MRKKVPIALSVCLFVSSVAMAGPLLGDPLAYQGWTGATVLDSGSGLVVSVEYCVYGPGDFPYVDPNYTSAPNQFAYVYQVYSIGSVEMNSLTIGMLESNEADGIGSIDLGTGGIAPASASFGGSPPTLDSANWSWAELGGLQPSQYSNGLVYYSVNEPLWWFGSVKNDTQVASGFLPSPSDVIPEPATLSLLVGGAVFALRRRKR